LTIKSNCPRGTQFKRTVYLLIFPYILGRANKHSIGSNKQGENKHLVGSNNQGQIPKVLGES